MAFGAAPAEASEELAVHGLPRARCPEGTMAFGAAPAEELCAGVERALVCAESSAADAAPVLKAACERLEAEAAAGPLLAALLRADVPALLLAAVPSLEFEAQKLAARLCEGVLRAACGERLSEGASAYLCGRPGAVELLLCGSCDERLTFLYGELLLLGTRDTSFARVLLEGGADTRLLGVAASPSGIEVKAMALACLRGLLLESGDAAPEHLEDHENFRRFFTAYHKLVTDEALLVQRQAQDLLAHVLLSPEFSSVRAMYVSSAACLKLQMSLLRHPVASVRLGAFHVFKIFVANPRKRRSVQALLHRNKEPLVHLLTGLGEADDSCSADLGAVGAAMLELTAPPSAPGKSADGLTCRKGCLVSPCC